MGSGLSKSVVDLHEKGREGAVYAAALGVATVAEKGAQMLGEAAWKLEQRLDDEQPLSRQKVESDLDVASVLLEAARPVALQEVVDVYGGDITPAAARRHTEQMIKNIAENLNEVDILLSNGVLNEHSLAPYPTTYTFDNSGLGLD